jgi:hypothetical protein
VLDERQLGARSAGEGARAEANEHLQFATIDLLSFHAAQEVQQAGEGAEDSPHLQDLPYRLGAQSANGGEGHADRATDRSRTSGRDQLECIGVDNRVSIATAVDARWQQQDAPLAGFLGRGAQPVVGGAAVVQDLGEEGRPESAPLPTPQSLCRH